MPTFVVVATAVLVFAAPGAAAANAAMPAWAQQGDSAYGCVICHADKRRSFSVGVHSERGIRCHDCHGGDTEAYEIAPAHRGRFVGTPTKLETIELCSECHADPNQMRQFGLAHAAREGRGTRLAPFCPCFDSLTLSLP